MNDGTLRDVRRSDGERKVWHKGVLVPDWAEACEFRRVVIKKDGTVLNGACRIERLATDAPAAPPAAPKVPLDIGFSGMFEPEPKAAPAAPAPAAPAPAAPAPVDEEALVQQDQLGELAADVKVNGNDASTDPQGV